MSSELMGKPKVHWTPEVHRVFVDACLDQTLKGNRPSTCFTKYGWEYILQALNRIDGLHIDKKQLTNHWDITKEHWKTWCKLVNTRMMKWNPETGSFGATDADWSYYLRVHPEAGIFRFKPLQHREKLEIVFDFMNLEDGRETLSLECPEDMKTNHLFEDASDSGFAFYYNDGRATAASEQSMSGSTSVRSRKPHFSWTSSEESHRTFIDLCLEQVSVGNKRGSHLSKEGWINLIDSFYTRTGVMLNKVQFKNHWDSVKKQWRIWSKLVATSYMKWDPVAQKFGATEREWNNYIHEYPEAAQFRLKVLQFADKLDLLFEGTTVVEDYNVEPLSQRRRLDHDDPTRKYCESSPLIMQQYDVGFVKTQTAESRPSYSIGDCIERLDGMKEIEQGSELYLFALDMFMKKEYREIFLELKNPSVRIAWLRRLVLRARSFHH
ncbi:unnamed protein product [Linum tenue]|uniref:Myb/SANT-like domain-containing protein n=1 Tax=Linum tenue TaxID=586396 RepID=A0AAV0JNJ0_9ROSI|nr:unnamed protein product [Linum tenue]